MERRPSAKALATARNYHSVTIVTGRCACKAAVAIGGQRLLAQHAPLLPLELCSDIEACHCIYLHHNDRRQQDRRQDFLLSNIVEDDRREGKDRRHLSTWRQNNQPPSIDDVKNSVREIQVLVDSLLNGDTHVKLDDLYVSLERLREDVEYKVLLDSANG